MVVRTSKMRRRARLLEVDLQKEAPNRQIGESIKSIAS